MAEVVYERGYVGDVTGEYNGVVTNKELAENELLKLEEKWGEQYPVVIRSWQDN